MSFRTIISLIIAFSLMGTCFSAYAAETDSDRLVYHAQMRLIHKGYKPGPVDGLMGKKTRKAIANFQWDTGLPITGELDRKTLKALGLTVSSYAQVGAARLKVLDVPAQEYTQEELVNRLKHLRVRFDGGRHLMLFDVDGFTVHTGHINQLIKDECIRPYDISIGEMHVQGQSLKSEDFGDIFAGALAGEMYKLHNGRKNNAIRNTTKAAVLVCTAAMF
jgi:peptidoglycan hydrolase-like protein with peptidoglycan-binding domain